MSRSEQSHTVMIEVLIACRKQGMSPEQTAKEIDASYPFGERSCHPYKVWLKVRKDFFAAHGLPRNGDHADARSREDDLLARAGFSRAAAEIEKGTQ